MDGKEFFALAQKLVQIKKYSREPFRTQLKNGLHEYHAKINPKFSERS